MHPYRVSLDVVEVESPCTERWLEMEGTETVRYCRACDSHVYNLSAMTRAEAETLLAVTEGRVCVRFYRRADGTMATRDCRRPRAAWYRRQRRRRILRGVAGVLLGGVLAVGVSAFPRRLTSRPAPRSRSFELSPSASVHREAPADAPHHPLAGWSMGGAHLPAEAEASEGVFVR
jgi:anti-sigma factor RsiW